jgi:hypothetical protein
MVGEYVRIVATPHRTGTVIAARYQAGRIMYLFRLDPRLRETFADMWFLDCELEECCRPTDEQMGLTSNDRRQG